jgi:hypothetical protein
VWVKRILAQTSRIVSGVAQKNPASNFKHYFLKCIVLSWRCYWIFPPFDIYLVWPIFLTFHCFLFF